MTERRPIPGMEGFYEACADGFVYSVPRAVLRKKGGSYRVQARRMSEKVMSKGYRIVHIRINGGSHMRLVHRCVLAAFSAEPPAPGNMVNHKNGIPGDNRLSNLEWCTRSENALHSYRVLGNPRPKPAKGADSPISKAVVGVDPSSGLERRFNWMGAAVQEGFTVSGISSAISGKQKSHRSLIWSFV